MVENLHAGTDCNRLETIMDNVEVAVAELKEKLTHIEEQVISTVGSMLGEEPRECSEEPKDGSCSSFVRVMCIIGDSNKMLVYIESSLDRLKK